MGEVAAGDMDQRVTWLTPPATTTDDFSEDAPAPPLWTEGDTVWAKVEEMPTTRANAVGNGQPQAVYKLTMRLLPALTKQNVGRWAQPGGGDANIFLQVQSISPPQNSGTLVVMAVQVTNPDVSSGAIPC